MNANRIANVIAALIVLFGLIFFTEFTITAILYYILFDCIASLALWAHTQYKLWLVRPIIGECTRM